MEYIKIKLTLNTILKMKNNLLDSYYRMLYFCKGKPSTLGILCNYELNAVLYHISKYPVGLLNGYNKSEYVLAVNYILKCRSQSKDWRLRNIETKYANKALIAAEKLSNEILKMMIQTEKQYEHSK
jgi:hypothetical protein